MSEVAAVTDADFESQVLKAGEPVLVDFWAAWCGPCRMVAPLVDEVAREVAGVRVRKLDVDANPKTQRDYAVMSIPTLIIFKDGRPAERLVGFRPSLKRDLKEKLAALVQA
ncbi:MAG: thioredoxin [Candidatus Dormibacteraeota bacterium]|nr:thioredoxin [Candidatus Dormibacteraeota bacterium]